MATLSGSITSCRAPDRITTRNGWNGLPRRNSRTTSSIAPLHHVRVLGVRTQALLLLELDVEAQAADLVAQHVEADRGAGFERVGALHHRLVDLGAALDVVGLDGQQLLEHVGRAVRLQAPDLHLAEALAAGAGLAAEDR